jgi:nucleoside-diphosphate-sugar epimerase
LKKIVVTGGSGVIGKELIKLLLKDNSNILNIDTTEILDKTIQSHPNYKYLQQDISKLNDKTLLDYRPNEIYHLAAVFERTEESASHFNNNYISNISATHNLLKISSNIESLKKFIFASSYLVYDSNLYMFQNPDNKTKYLNEGDAKSPRNLTGYSKYYNEKELRFMFKNHTSVDYISARIFRGYGIGSKDFISRTIDNLINNRKIEIYNSEGAFDYLYSKDAATGLKKLSEIGYSGEVNLGAGKSRSINSVLSEIEKVFGKFEYSKISRSEIGYENSASDNTLLESLIGWKPDYGFSNSISDLFNHYDN